MKSESINISFNPSYQCNFRCNFCYLSKNDLESSNKIESNKLFEILSEVSQFRKISHVDFYGGEVSLLNSNVINNYIETFRYFYKGIINVTTNYAIENEILLKPDFDLSISWDYKARAKWDHVYANMMKLTKPFHVLTLASRKVVDFSDKELREMIGLLNALPAIQTLEIKPFSKNRNSTAMVSHDEYENFIKRIFKFSNEFKFKFINEQKIENSIQLISSAWSDDHIYITPNGKIAVLEFDDNHNEYFMELDSFEEYEKWSEHEKSKIKSNIFCSNCKYVGHCLSEHLQIVLDLKHSCNGYKNLLDWYNSERI